MLELMIPGEVLIVTGCLILAVTAWWARKDIAEAFPLTITRWSKAKWMQNKAARSFLSLCIIIFLLPWIFGLMMLLVLVSVNVFAWVLNTFFDAGIDPISLAIHSDLCYYLVTISEA